MNFVGAIWSTTAPHEPRLVSDVDRVERLDLLGDFSTTFRRRRDLLFQFRLQIFRRRVGIFSLFFLCCFYFLLKVHVNFSSVFYRDYRAVVTSSRHRPFCFHNFVFLLNCLFVLYWPIGNRSALTLSLFIRNMQRATRISVCVIAVSRLNHTNFCWKFVEFLRCFRRRRRTPSRRRVVIFSTTTQGIRLRRRVDVFYTTSVTNHDHKQCIAYVNV